MITAIIILGCFAVSNIIIPSLASTENPIAKAQSSTDKESRDVYFITSLDGRLVVYKENVSSPYIKTDTLLNTLPKADKEKIEKGIYIYGEANLKKALEDYCS